MLERMDAAPLCVASFRAPQSPGMSRLPRGRRRVFMIVRDIAHVRGRRVELSESDQGVLPT